MIERQQTKIAAATTRRKTVEKTSPKFASMMFAGPQPSLIAVPEAREISLVAPGMVGRLFRHQSASRIGNRPM
jgi:hypothetical protein